MFNDILIKEFTNPKRIGKIKNADFILEKKSNQCGDIIKLYINVKDDIITEVKFQAFGCFGVVAGGSLLCQFIEHKNINSLKNLKLSDYIDLNNVPKEKINCLNLSISCFNQIF